MQPSQMGDKRHLWINFHWVKAILSILIFSPLLHLLSCPKLVMIDIQFYWLITILILSPFARYYREWYIAKERARVLEEGSEISLVGKQV